MAKKFNYQKLLTFLFVILLGSFLLCFSTILGETQAQIPTPDVPCDEVRPGNTTNPGNFFDLEFHSLRPYQASPCNKVIETVIACGNDLIVQKKYDVSPSAATSCSTNADGSRTCQFNFVGETTNIKVSLPDAELPIVGNTQLVPNSASDANTLNPAQRTNQYVSWYLQGTSYRAEDELVEASIENNDPLNFAGPIRKLLPQSVIHQKQIETIKQRGTAAGQHNQVAVCANEETFGIIGDLLGIGKTTPQPCYENTLIPGTTNGTAYRLEDWDKDLTWQGDTIAAIVNAFTSLLPDVPANIIETAVGNPWNKRVPPLPSDPDFEGSSIEFQKAYNEWRGKSCIIVPGINFLFCVENIFVPNRYADLFPYVPLASTEDRIGKVTVNDAQAPQPDQDDGVTVSGVVYEPGETSENLVYVPHMEETGELLSLLQSTYVAKGQPDGSGNEVDDRPFSTDTNCDLTQVGWNSGDDLFGEYDNDPIAGTLNYNVSFSCTFGSPTLDESGSCYQDCLADAQDPGDIQVCRQRCSTTNTCEKEANVALSVYTKTPKINNLWYQTVFGEMSVFKRIFPQALSGKSQTLDLPGVTTARYEAEGDDVTVLAGDPENERAGARAEIFIPHLGGVQEYFLKGIQKALRPKDIGSVEGQAGIPVAGEINCDKSAPDITHPGLISKAGYVDLATRWTTVPGTHAADCYNDTVRKALAAGVNPGLALWIWVHESAASNYNVSVEDFGVHFGQPIGYIAQIQGFLSRARSYNRSHYTCEGKPISNDLQAFAYIYKSGRCDNTGPGAEEFWRNLNDQFNLVAPGCSLPDSPTDMSC